MNSIRGKLLNVLTVFSLVFFFLMVMAWIFSAFVEASYLKTVGPQSVRMILIHHGFIQYIASYPLARPIHGPIDGFTFEVKSNIESFNWAFYLGQRSAESPILFFAFPFAILPLARVSKWVWKLRRSDIRRERQLRGHCPQCGYDIRATPQQCPECGSTPRALPFASGLPNRQQILYYIAILGFSALAIRASLALRFIDFSELRSNTHDYLMGIGKLDVERAYPGMFISIVSVTIVVMFVRKLKRSYQNHRPFITDAAATTR